MPVSINTTSSGSNTRMHPRRIFLLDGTGALLSALLLGAVLAQWPNVFGMPAAVVYALAGVALVFCLYSASSYLWAGKHWRSCLRTVAVANALYAATTLGLTLWYSSWLRLWGWLYFGGELLIVAWLVRAEWRLLRASFINTKS